MLTIHGGRTRRLWLRLLQAVAESRRQDTRCVLLVPEQYTLQTERDLMDGLELPGFFDLEVLSPSRLTERVFAQAGSDGRVRIDARGKQCPIPVIETKKAFTAASGFRRRRFSFLGGGCRFS